MRLKIVPKDSYLQLWLKSLRITENPVSYQVLIGLSAVGALLRRSVYVDQVDWRVYPNMSVLLLGPSGVGKDTIINRAIKVIQTLDSKLILKGDTIEYITDELAKKADPASAYIPAPELTAFLGGKDYQKGIASTLTDLLSTNDKMLLGTKSSGARVILRPTITMHAGSTAEWLMNLPEDSMGGGFLPRFIIISADLPARHVAWVKYDNDAQTVKEALKAKEEFVKYVAETVKEFGGRTNPEAEYLMAPTKAAEDYYRNWYHNRFNKFSKAVKAYANRSRDHMHRIAMTMALTRGHGFLEDVDYVFADNVMEYIAAGIDGIVSPMLGRRKKGG